METSIKSAGVNKNLRSAEHRPLQQALLGALLRLLGAFPRRLLLVRLAPQPRLGGFRHLGKRRTAKRGGWNFPNGTKWWKHGGNMEKNNGKNHGWMVLDLLDSESSGSMFDKNSCYVLLVYDLNLRVIPLSIPRGCIWCALNCPCKFGLHGPQLLRLDIYQNCITIPNHHQSNLVSSIYKSSNVSGWWFFATPLKKWWSKSVGMFWNSQHDGKVMQNSMVPVTTNQLYSPIINHYQPLLTMINQDYPIYYGKSTILSIINYTPYILPVIHYYPCVPFTLWLLRFLIKSSSEQPFIGPWISIRTCSKIVASTVVPPTLRAQGSRDHRSGFLASYITVMALY